MLRGRSSKLLVVCLMWLCGLGAALAGPAAMTALAERYYGIVLGRQSSGLPDAGLQQQLAPLLGQRLRLALTEALAAEKRHIAATPAGDKPAIFEGDILTGIYEGGQEVDLDDPKPADHPPGGTIAATVIYLDQRFAVGHRHRVAISRDELRFAMEDGEIRIVDLRTGLDRPGPGPDSLVTTLEDYIRSAPR